MRSTRSDQGIAVLIIFTVTSLAFASILAPSFGCGCSSAENGDEADDDTSTDGDDEDYHPPHEDMIYVSSIAVDESDHAHLVYNSKATRTFRYATNASGTWTKATVSPWILTSRTAITE
ncbi:MAG: hypothetical protein M5R36_14245 [Deltaproteobacteria bacterium]|nr:hypothetical protein [Deltaproteobacteria bacterium]